jgi:hypothetical protein
MNLHTPDNGEKFIVELSNATRTTSREGSVRVGSTRPHLGRLTRAFLQHGVSASTWLGSRVGPTGHRSRFLSRLDQLVQSSAGAGRVQRGPTVFGVGFCLAVCSLYLGPAPLPSDAGAPSGPTIVRGRCEPDTRLGPH